MEKDVNVRPGSNTAVAIGRTVLRLDELIGSSVGAMGLDRPYNPDIAGALVEINRHLLFIIKFMSCFTFIQ